MVIMPGNVTTELVMNTGTATKQLQWLGENVNQQPKYTELTERKGLHNFFRLYISNRVNQQNRGVIFC